MSTFWPKPYSERKQHPLLLKVWRIYNMVVFPLLPNCLRLASLRLFGATITAHCIIYRSVKIYAPWNLVKTGDGCIGPRVEIYNKDKIVLGEGVIISQDSYLCTASHDVNSPVMALVTKPIILEDNVWVAARTIILPGVIAHEASVVGCGSVVTKDVDPWTVVGGNPARFLKRRILDTGATMS